MLHLQVAVKLVILEFTTLRQVFHLLLFAFVLVRDVFAPLRCQIFSAPGDDGADPGALESSGASSRFRSSTHNSCLLSPPMPDFNLDIKALRID